MADNKRLHYEASIGEIGKTILDSGQVEIRDVDGGQEPFVYTTGNRGPGYIMIKGLVGQPEILKFLTGQLAQKVVKEAEFDFIEGNATGGMVPGWQLRNDVSEILGKEVPYCYLRGSRKEGGHGELITGDSNNPLIHKGMYALVVEELVNYARTTSNAAVAFRDAGYRVSHAASLLSYDHPESNARLEEKRVSLVTLITLPRLLDVGEEKGKLSKGGIKCYREFLKDPLLFQLKRGYVVPEETAKGAIKRGFSMRELGKKEAISMGAPIGKLKEGIVYWAQE